MAAKLLTQENGLGGMLTNMTPDEFLKLTPKKVKEKTGKKLTLKQVVGLKAAQKAVKKQMKDTDGMADTAKSQWVALLLFFRLWPINGYNGFWPVGKNSYNYEPPTDFNLLRRKKPAIATALAGFFVPVNLIEDGPALKIAFPHFQFLTTVFDCFEKKLAVYCIFNGTPTFGSNINHFKCYQSL